MHYNSVTVVLQCKQVSGKGLRKRSSAPPYDGPCGSLLFPFPFTFFYNLSISGCSILLPPCFVYVITPVCVVSSTLRMHRISRDPELHFPLNLKISPVCRLKWRHFTQKVNIFWLRPPRFSTGQEIPAVKNEGQRLAIGSVRITSPNLSTCCIAVPMRILVQILWGRAPQKRPKFGAISVNMERIEISTIGTRRTTTRSLPRQSA